MALLPDGSALIAVLANRTPGPIGLYRADARTGAFDVLQPSPREPKRKVAPRADIVSVGTINHLVASPRGAWFIASSNGPIAPGVWPPTLVYELVGDRLALARPPFSVPLLQFERPVAACAIGNQVAMAMDGRAFGLVITDGIVAHRVEGTLGWGETSGGAEALLASPARDALLLGFHFGVARAELLREGDPRLAEPAYDEVQPAPERRVPEPPPPPPTPLDRQGWIARVRLSYVIQCISQVHYGSANAAPMFEGDGKSGRFWSDDGSGGHHVIGWSEAGVVALGWDCDWGAVRPAELLGELPENLKELGAALLKWKRPAADIVWFSVKESRGGEAKQTDQLDRYLELDEANMHASFREAHGISEAQLALAVDLARASASGRHTLTAAEAAVLLTHPEQPGKTPPTEDVETGRKLLEAVGVDWGAADDV